MPHGMKMASLVGVAFLLVLNGCAELIIKHEDDGAAIIGKVMYRTVFAIGSLGYSEIKMDELTRDYERGQKLRAYEARVLEFLEKGEVTQAEARHMIRKERARLWDHEGEETQDLQTR